MNYYKIKYATGEIRAVAAASSLDVIKQFDLATKEHINTRVTQLEGEQAAIAKANFDECDGLHDSLNDLFECQSCSMII